MGSTVYSNGILPDFLKNDAYITAETNEFALNMDGAKQYLDWCRRNNRHVVGLEAWRLTSDGHAVVEGAGVEGDAHACKAALETLSAEHGSDIVLSIWSEPE